MAYRAYINDYEEWEIFEGKLGSPTETEAMAERLKWIIELYGLVGVKPFVRSEYLRILGEFPEFFV